MDNVHSRYINSPSPRQHIRTNSLLDPGHSRGSNMEGETFSLENDTSELQSDT